MTKRLLPVLLTSFYSLSTLAQGAALVSTAAANAPTITLNQKSVADLALKQSPRALEVNLRYQQYRLDPVLALAAYDWRITAQSGLEWDKSASILTSTNTTVAQYERMRSNVALQKPFTTGTLLGVELSRLNQKVTYDGTPTFTAPSEQTLDSAGITLEQSLLGNSFGATDRATVKAAKLNYEANNILRLDELEGVVLQSVRQFWTTYVALESYKEAINSRDRYKRLVDAIKRKTSLGYSNPGDLPQVQAEFEAREQKVNIATYEYLKAEEDFRTMLGLAPGTKINFEIPQTLPTVPSWSLKSPEELRSIKAQKLRSEASQESLDAAESSRLPTLNFVGRAFTSGVGETPQASFGDLSSVERPSYYAGLKFQYNFGSGAQRETVLNRQLNRDLQSSILARQTLESADTETQSKRRVEARYTIAVSSQRQKEYRDKAQQELNRSYNQGRTDISILINAINAFYDSQVQYTRYLGEYAMALNEWAAVRDELVPDEGVK